MPMHVSSVLVSMSVCVSPPHPHFGSLLFVFYQSRLVLVLIRSSLGRRHDVVLG